MPKQPEVTQKAQVLEIIENAGPLRTEQVKRLADKRGISCGDTYLRMLARDQKIMRFWELNEKGKHKNDTKSWCSIAYYNENIRPNIGVKYAA